MSSTQVHSETAIARTVDLKLEVVVIPCLGGRSRQALLRRLGLEARRRLRHEWQGGKPLIWRPLAQTRIASSTPATRHSFRRATTSYRVGAIRKLSSRSCRDT